MKQRKRREDVKKLPVGGFGGWQTIMCPSGPDPYNRFTTRTGEGLRLKDNLFPENEGIYEVRVVPPDGGKPNVIYLGKAGGEGTNSTLRQRMGQYMNNGSHKADLYNSLLKAGCVIQVRTKNTGSYSTRGRGASERAKDAETSLLNQFDYAANKMENGKLRLDEVKIKVNGKTTSIDALVKKYRYKSKADKTVTDKTRKEARPGMSTGKSAARGGKRGGKSTTKSPTAPKLRKGGTPDMRYKENKAKVAAVLEKKSDAKSTASNSSKVLSPSTPSKTGPLKADGTPDMRYKENKAKVAAVLEKKSDARSTALKSSKVLSPSNPSKTGPLKADGTPDMRYKANYETPSSTTSTSPSSSGPLKADGTPDMRYKANRVPRGRYSSDSDDRDDDYGLDDMYPSSSSGPLKADGTPDMRYTANRVTRDWYADASDDDWDYGYDDYDYDYDTPMTKSGRPDMRYSINKQLYG
jgi:hypothetical protein